MKIIFNKIAIYKAKFTNVRRLSLGIIALGHFTALCTSIIGKSDRKYTIIDSDDRVALTTFDRNQQFYCTVVPDIPRTEHK